MRVAFVADALCAGGAQKMMAFVINSISNITESIIIILQDDSGISYPLPKKAVVVSFSNEKKNSNHVNNKLGKIRALLNRVHETNSILKRYNIDVVCGFGAYYATIAVLAARKTCKALVSERRSPAHLEKIWQEISKWIYKKADLTVFQTNGAKSFYKKLDNNRTIIIPNPYMGTTDPPVRIGETRRVIAMAAARLEYEKGFDIGIKAMRIVVEKHPDYKMEIYGKGNFNEIYGDLIHSLGLENVIEYKGLSKNIIKDICDVDIFLLPSRIEGIPNILLEALGAGVPCIAADCPPGGSRLLIGSDEFGLLVPVENVEETARSIIRLIEDVPLRKDYKAKTEMFRERFRENDISDLWQKAFLRVANN